MTRLTAISVLLAAASLRGQNVEANERQALQDEVRSLKEQLRAAQEHLEAVEKRLSTLGPPAPEPQEAPAGLDGHMESASILPDAGFRPVDLSGYFSAGYIRDVNTPGRGSFQATTESLFVDKTIGKWQFHSELEFEQSPHIEVAPGSGVEGNGEINLETAWVNYSQRDWLNARAGILMIPTYWRVHHYPSTTLTVENPLIDEQIFPADTVGVMIHGSRYLENFGVDYSYYAGNGRSPTAEADEASGHKASGGTFLMHIPTAGFLQTLDVGVQYYRDTQGNDDRQRIFGFEGKIDKNSFGFLGEFAHAGIGPGGQARRYLRQGYYLQPSWRFGRGLYLVYRYDRLVDDTGWLRDGFLDRQTIGWTYRPVPPVSLKIEFNRYSAPLVAGTHSGLAAGLAFFFR